MGMALAPVLFPSLLVMLLVTLTIAMTVSGVLSHPIHLHFVRPYLARHRGFVCAACGYDLRGTSTRCPECGGDVPPSVGRGWAPPDAESRCQGAPARTAGHPVAYRFVVRRHLFIVAVFLLAGAVVNVAVAWGCVALKPCTTVHNTTMRWSSWTTRWPNETLTPEEVAAVWRRFARPSLRSVLSASDYDGIRRHGFGLTSRCISNSFLHDMLGRVTGVNAGASTHFIWMVEAGWPARCFRRGWDVIPVQAAPRVVALDGPLLLVPQSAGVASRTGDALQYRPLWPGFAINTLFYATTLWLLIGGPFALRRFVRMKRGLCPKCAYPMGESAVCSECGKALSTCSHG